MEKTIPFSYCLGISTFSVPLELLENINEQGTTRDDGIVGLLFGNKGKTDISVEKSLELNCNEWKKNLIVIENICQENKTEFLGFYSHGQLPDEKDIDNLENAMRSLKSSIFLLKFDHLNEDDMSALFECVLDKSHINSERIMIIQAHSTADGQCGNLINEIKPSDEKMAIKSKIFYFGLQYNLFDQLARLDKLDLPEAQKEKMIESIHNIHPTFNEHQKTLHQIAVAKGLTSLLESLLDGISMMKKEPDFDCIKTLRDLCRKGKVDVTYNFEIELNRSNEERFSCFIKIQDRYIGTGFENSLKTSYVASTCAVLTGFCVSEMCNLAI